MSVEKSEENHQELLALRVLENLYECDDAADDEPVDPESIQRMRAAIDHAFERAWKEVHAQAEAEAREAARARSRPSLAGLTRDALLARLATLQARPDLRVQVAFRKVTDLSDDDLRALIEDLEKDASKADATRR